MIIYSATKKQFLIDASNGIETMLQTALREKQNKNISDDSAEFRSWKNSLGNYVFHLLNTDLIDDNVQVALELVIHRSSKRLDLLLAGVSPQQNEAALIIELKQWDKVGITHKDGIVTTRFSSGITETNHPAYQAWSYSTLILLFNEYVNKNNVQLHSCSYLHNYTDDAVISDPFYSKYISQSPLFLEEKKENYKNS